MTSPSFLFASLAAFCITVTGGAATLSESSSLTDYLAFGIANNPGLQAEYENYQAVLEKIPQARSLPDPKMTATHFVEDIQTRTGPQENQVFFSQMFPWFGKRRLRGEVASKEAEAIEHLYQAQILALAKEIGVAYYNYGYLGEATKITREVLTLLERLQPNVEEKVRGGGDLAPLLRLEVEIAKNRDMLQALEKQRGSQSAAIDALLGRRNTNALQFPALLSPPRHQPGRSELVATLLSENPELKSLQSGIEKAAEAVKLSKLSPIPDPTVGVGAFDTGNALNPATVGSGDDPWAVQVSFSIPLWSGKYKAEKREAQARYNAAKKTLSNRENELLAQLERILQDLAEAEERIVLYGTTLLPKARQAVEVTEQSYKADRASILDLIDSERSLLEIERNYWRAVADQYQSLVRLQTLTGKRPK
tara:strand:- start:1369 stop:2634 length:1266 start_codon:yes stop_codon:yes gene_type:complete